MHNKIVTIKCPDREEDISFSMDVDLKNSLDRIKERMWRKDFDYVLAIDGMEGAGKSTFALQIGKYIDNSLSLDRVCFSGKEFKEAILKAKKGECVIFDEAFLGLSSRGALTEVNRMLVSLMMQMRQKNLFVIIVLPTFFLLDKYVSLFRTKSLIHTHMAKGKRGYFRLFNSKDKKLMYLRGQKLYLYDFKLTKFRGRFYGKFALGEEHEEAYRNKKMKALEELEEVVVLSKYVLQRNKLIYIMNKELGLTQQKIAEWCLNYNINLKQSAISTIITNYEEKQGNY